MRLLHLVRSVAWLPYYESRVFMREESHGWGCLLGFVRVGDCYFVRPFLGHSRTIGTEHNRTRTLLVAFVY